MKNRPTQISLAISTDIRSLSYRFHGLKELSSFKTLAKFLVLGVEVDETKSPRYYSVSMLQRISPDGKERAEEVDKLWTVRTVDGKTTYEETHKETVEIINPLAAAVRYEKDRSPANWGKDGLDNHFIAFDTDLPIDDLLEADVSFRTVATGDDVGGSKSNTLTFFDRSVITGLAAGKGITYSEAIKDYATQNNKYSEGNVTVKKDDRYSFGSGGWFSEKTYSWNKIMRSVDFVRTIEDGTVHSFSGDYNQSDITDRTWVVAYRATPFDQVNNFVEDLFDETGGYWYDFEIAVLRLKFETQGVVYDMGTVSDKVDQSFIIQGNTPMGFWESIGAWFQENWKWLVTAVIIIALLVIFLPILSPFLPAIIKGIGKFFVMLLKGLWWLISAPFRFIKWLIDKKGGGA